jgi:hypothetical protein
MRVRTSRAGRGARAAIAIVSIAATGLGCAATRPGGNAPVIVAGGEALDPALRARLATSRVWPPAALLAQLADAGYLDARVCRGIDSLWTITPGAPVDSIRLVWEESGRTSSTASAIPFGGEGAAARIERAAAQRLARCAETGRPLASLRVTGADLSPAPTLTLRLDPGPAVRVTGVAFGGNRVTRASYLKRVIGWRNPEVYRDRRWSEARDALLATGLFRRVEGPDILTGPAAGRTAPDSLAAPVLFHLEEQPVSRIRGLLGYARRAGETKGGGWSGFVDLTLGNLFGTGRAAHALWEGLGEGRSRLELEWHEPYLWKLPLAADLALKHFQEDTLYAETSWGADVVWRPVPDWRVAVGLSRTRLVLGGGIDRTQRRETSRFGLERRPAAADPWRTDWALRSEATRTQGDADLRSARATLDEQVTRGGWGVWLEQQTGLVAGADSLLRSDVFRFGGAASLRGSLEGEFLARTFVLQRTEVGRRLDRLGARAYLLADFGWIEPWRAGPNGLTGAAGGWREHTAVGAGLQLPSRAGWIRLEFAVPGGAGLGRGRIHLGLEGAF